MITCMSEELKTLLVELLKEAGADGETVSKVMLMKKCQDDSPLNVEKKQGKTKTKREPSAYQQHMSTCMKQPSDNKKDLMRSCAKDWSAKKGSA
ncbi:MAG: hypothetical protein Q8P31_09475 [Bacillota bacterium]|nr:hypothetical protein [Bacillota bacterium]